MNLKDQIMADLKTAMKSGEQARLTVLRGLLSTLNNKAIEKRTKAVQGGQAGKEETLTDDEILSCLATEAKKRKDSIALYTQGNREDLAASEKQELEIIQTYLPKQLSKEETEAAVTAIVTKSTSKEFGPIMKEVMKELKGKADATLITEIVKKKLG